MLKATSIETQTNNFNLKHELVELVPVTRSRVSEALSVEELEAIRTKRSNIPASKHGLETICGASCETGAQ